VAGSGRHGGVPVEGGSDGGGGGLGGGPAARGEGEGGAAGAVLERDEKHHAGPAGGVTQEGSGESSNAWRWNGGERGGPGVVGNGSGGRHQPPAGKT
jgi:hypothetical protein